MKKRMNKIISLITKNKRKVVLLTIILLMVFTSAFIYINLTNPTKINSLIASVVNKGAPANKAFEDEIFYKAVVDAYNKENKTSLPYTTNLTDEQLKTITSVSCYYSEMNSSKGLEKLTNLTDLDLHSNNLSSIDLSKNTALTDLKLYYNNLSSIDLSKNTALKYLDLRNNELNTIDVSNNVVLEDLYLDNNELSEIDVSNNTALTHLKLHQNNLNEIDISNNTALKILIVTSNNLSTIDLGENAVLTHLSLGYNELRFIDVSNNTALIDLNLYANNLSSIDVSNNTALTDLVLNQNNLNEINLSKNIALTHLDLWRNNLSSIDLSNNSSLTDLNLSSNNLGGIDLSKNTALTDLNLSSNNLSSIDLGKNITLKTLNLANNPLTLGEYRLIKGTSVEGNGVGNVKLPEQFPITYEMEDSSISTYEDGVIKGLKSGTTNLKGTIKEVGSSGKDLVVKGSIKVFDIKSHKYEINKEDKYIYTKMDTDDSTIMKNITVENGTGKIEGNVFKVMDEDVVVEEYKLVNYSSSVYDLSKEYIYVGTNSFSASNIKLVNLTTTLNNNTLEIKYGNTVMESYKIVSVSSSKYDLSKDSIRLKEDESFDLNSINVVNGTKEYKDNKLYIKYGNEILKTYEITYSSSRLKGDVNNDDKITIIDVSMLYRHVKKREVITDNETFLISDINGDGQITVIDVSMLYRYVKGKINEL